MTQYVINIGALPNDGTGDPLRTAFNDVNLNFDQVFAAGPVLSNIQIANNTILTTNTNGNLILAPNGIGVVQANVNIVPNSANIRNLGSDTRRWSTVYTQYLNLSGSAIFGGDLTVAGNLTVNGNIIELGNIVTDSKTIQLANTATTANAANGSGITVGANDNIATLLYNSTSNVWTTNIGISTAGNITGGNISGNITGNISAPDGNGSVVFNDGGVLGAGPGFNYDKTGNILYAPAAAFRGLTDGSNGLFVGYPAFTELGSSIMAQFTGNVADYSQINFQNISNSNVASGDYIITADNGTDSTNFLDLGMTSSTWDGTQTNSLGNKIGPNEGYLYVQDGNLNLGTSTGSGTSVWTLDTTGNLTLPGNTFAVNYANGAPVSFASSGGVIQSNVAPSSPTDSTLWWDENSGRLYIWYNDGDSEQWVDASPASGVGSTSGNGSVDLTQVSSNIVPASNVVYNLGNATNQWNDLYLSNATIYMNNVPVGLTSSNVLTVNGEAVLTNNSNTTVSTTGNITANYFIGNGSQLTGIVASYGNANVANYLPTYTGNIGANAIAATGNITGANIFGNIQAADGNTSVQINVNGFLGAAPGFNYSGNTLYAPTAAFPGDSNGSNGLFVGYPAFTELGSNILGQFTGNSSTYTQINLQNISNSASASGDYIITANNGNDTTHFLDIGMTSSTWNGTQENSLGNSLSPGDGYMYVQDGNLALAVKDGSQYVWYFDSNGALTFPDSSNILNGAFNGTPSSSVSLNAFSPDGNTVSFQAQGNTSNAVIQTYANATTTTNNWTFDTAGNLTLPASGDLNLNNGDIYQSQNNNLTISVQDQDNDGWSLDSVVTDGSGNTLSFTRLQRDEFRVTTDAAGVPRIWNFDNFGVLNLPGNINGVYAGDTSIYAVDDGATGSVELKTISYAGDTLGSNVRVTQNNATISTANAAFTWNFDNTGNLTVPGISTGSGTGEIQAIHGTRKTIGITNDPDFAYAATFAGHSDFGSLVYTATSSTVQSAKITFAISTNGAAFNWEQFDLATTKLDSANAFVSVSNRVRSNSGINYTEVSAYVNEAGAIEIWLNPPVGQTVAYVNYDAVEFNIPLD